MRHWVNVKMYYVTITFHIDINFKNKLYLIPCVQMTEEQKVIATLLKKIEERAIIPSNKMSSLNVILFSH